MEGRGGIWVGKRREGGRGWLVVDVDLCVYTIIIWVHKIVWEHFLCAARSPALKRLLHRAGKENMTMALGPIDSLSLSSLLADISRPRTSRGY